MASGKPDGVEFSDLIEKQFEKDVVTATRLRQDIDWKKSIEELCILYFGDFEQNYRTGLVYLYNKMAAEVRDKKLLGLVLAGLYLKDCHVMFYITKDDKTIDLTVASICFHLIQTCFKDAEDYESLCKASPGFSIYFK